MLKKFIQRYIPDHQAIRKHKNLQIFGNLLHDPNLFHLNRRSVAGAFAVGLFFAWVPVPFQMVFAAALAIFLRVNLPVSVALVWVSNPLTMPPLFYFAYLLGTWILGIPETKFHFELSFEWLGSGLHIIWQPFLLGCFVMGVVSSFLGYVSIRLLWRLSIVNRLKKKNLRRYKPPQI
ncbi:DUF2062 domain-containing protein [Sulfuriflexus mobilis]|uniref:DUF2062 domain-containing protein n=1 Tax=Sulfuriflexus mobilis TaxID=1811807 RepID=UPI000F84179A|nr:DUF2062 domain-containing protein [Sulfuriflexus mobilis]